MATVDMEETGRNITRFRENAGMSVKELQDRFGFGSVNTIYKWQKGISVPTIDNLVILAEIFGVTINEIVAVKIV